MLDKLTNGEFYLGIIIFVVEISLLHYLTKKTEPKYVKLFLLILVIAVFVGGILQFQYYYDVGTDLLSASFICLVSYLISAKSRRIDV